MTIIAAAAAAGLTTVGCMDKWGTDDGIQYLRLQTLEETENGVTTTTSYEWNENGAPSAETCKRGELTVYSDDNYSYEGRSVTFTRTYSGDTERTEKRKLTYLDSKYVTMDGIYIYEVEGSTETLIEKRVETYGSNGLITKYEYEKDGQTILMHTNFVYNYPTSTYDIAELIEGTVVNKKSVRTYLNMSFTRMKSEVITLAGSDEEIKRVDYLYNESGGYEYKGYTIKENGKITEKQTDYLVSNNVVSYNLIKYNSEEQPVSTKKVKRTYVASKN